MSKSNSSFWYDTVAPIYDWAIQKMYRPYRKSAVADLNLALGQTVLDLGCGSGLNFDLIKEAIGPEGVLIGVDYSEKMLARARQKVEGSGWQNLHLMKLDVREIDTHPFFDEFRAQKKIDRVICTLGFSVFPDWQDVFAKSYDLLAPEGYYSLMDLHQEHKSAMTRLVDFLASSEISRKVWQPLKSVCATYKETKHTLPHGSGEIVIASGQKIQNTLDRG